MLVLNLMMLGWDSLKYYGNSNGADQPPTPSKDDKKD